MGGAAEYGCWFEDCERDSLSYCKDGVRYNCEAGVFVANHCAKETTCHLDTFEFGEFGTFDCYRYGRQACAETRDEETGRGTAQCVGTGGYCENEFAPARCVDDFTVESCTRLKRIGTIHCPDWWVGSRCVPDWGDGRGAACSPPDHECTLEAPECDGNHLKVCVGGHWERLDCAEIGMVCDTFVLANGGREDVSGCYYPR